MPSDIMRFKVQLGVHLEDLSRLEVVEAAEDIVRRRHSQLWASELAGLGDDLANARQRLGVARKGGDLIYIIEIEEQVCRLLHQTTIMQRQTGEHIRSYKQAHDAYLARRGWLVERIDQLQRLVAS